MKDCNDPFYQRYDVFYDTCLTMTYKRDTGSFRAIRYDSIPWLEISAVTFFAKHGVKEKACFCAVVEEVKQWKRFSLCGAQTAASCRDPPWSEETLLTQHTRAERRRMTWSNLYDYLPSELRQIHPQNVWREKYKTLILSVDTIDFCFEKRF